MKSGLLEQQVERAARPVVERMGLEFVAVELAKEPAGMILRIMLDRPGGIDLDTLTEATRAIDPVIESEARIRGRYRLEVSSPGIERPLRSRADFERFRGERAYVRTSGKIDGRRNFTGTIESVAPDELCLRVDDAIFRIPLEQIAKAHLIVEV